MFVHLQNESTKRRLNKSWTQPTKQLLCNALGGILLGLILEPDVVKFFFRISHPKNNVDGWTRRKCWRWRRWFFGGVWRDSVRIIVRTIVGAVVVIVATWVVLVRRPNPIPGFCSMQSTYRGNCYISLIDNSVSGLGKNIGTEQFLQVKKVIGLCIFLYEKHIH